MWINLKYTFLFYFIKTIIKANIVPMYWNACTICAIKIYYNIAHCTGIQISSAHLDLKLFPYRPPLVHSSRE